MDDGHKDFYGLVVPFVIGCACLWGWEAGLIAWPIGAWLNRISSK